MTPARIYEAEYVLQKTFDRYWEGTEIIIHGVPVVLPRERKFVHVSEVQQYVQDFLRDPGVIKKYGLLPQVKVRDRKGERAAHYDTVRNEIAIPCQAAWACRELVVLHELAHHVQYQRSIIKKIVHNQEFMDIYVELLAIRMNEHARFVAQMCFIDAQIWNKYH